MPIIEPDFSQSSNVIPPGTYPCRVLTATVGPSKAGNPMVILELEVDVNGVLKNKTDWLVISGKGAYKFENFLRAAGFEEQANKVVNGEKTAIDSDDFVGNELFVIVEADTYNGAPSDTIKSYLRP